MGWEDGCSAPFSLDLVAMWLQVLSYQRESRWNGQCLCPELPRGQWSPHVVLCPLFGAHIVPCHPKYCFSLLGCSGHLRSRLWDTHVYLPHFINEKTEGQRRKELFQAHRCVSNRAGTEYRFPGSKSRALTPSNEVNISKFCPLVLGFRF